MDAQFLLPLLAMFTFLAVIVFAMRSKSQTEERLHSDSAPKSTLAKDAPDHKR